MKTSPAMDLSKLRSELESEIDSYAYYAPATIVGTQKPEDWISSQLDELRTALVTPTWREISICGSVNQTTGVVTYETRNCVLVADDRNGHELYYDPIATEFVLAYSGEPPRTFGVRGDAVGCFMAR